MGNLKDVYTRIRLQLGNEIIVTYYSDSGIKNTVKVLLLEIFNFEYILGGIDNKLVYINFLNEKQVIESIKLPNSNTPIYYNSYINSDIYDKGEIKLEYLYDIKKKMFGSENINFDLIDYKVEKYLDNWNFFEYDDLFFSKKQKEEFELFFCLLVNELALYAKKNKMDSKLRQICFGSTSIVYEIGNKIIKIGKPRRNKMIPYFEYLLQPIINRDFMFDGFPIHIEVTEKVFALENKDGCVIHSEDERFNSIVNVLGKIMYSVGLSSDDLHVGNVGILLDDNRIHYDSIDFDVGDENVTSILYNNNLRILNKGRFVIIDLDSLEIKDINKYCKYLKSIGYDYSKIKELYSKYRQKVKRDK